MRNVFTGLFLASIGLVISPVFILEHLRVLSVGALVVLLLKAGLISVVVWQFRVSWNTAVVVGVSLAQVCLLPPARYPLPPVVLVPALLQFSAPLLAQARPSLEAPPLACR